MSKWWILSLLICWEASGDSAKYWLLQQDFIKVGKRDLYEEVQQKQSKRPIRLGMEDLENAQYVFLEPLKTLGALAEYPPFAEDSLGLEARCLYFQIFSLLQLLPQFSNLEATFSASRPYYRYVVYEVSPASREAFEQELPQVVNMINEMRVPVCMWKFLLAAEVPKYLFCFSFPSKEALEESSLDAVLEKGKFKDALRGKKSSLMKRQDSLTLFP